MDIPLDRLLKIGYADLRAESGEISRNRAADRQNQDSATDSGGSRTRTTRRRIKLLQTFRNTLGGLRDFIISHQLVTIPSPVLPILEETPPFMRATTFASMDTPGPYETVAKEAFFNVTLPEKSWTPEHTESFMGQFNRGTILSTAIHEAYPGHYVQFLWMPRIQSRVRKLLGASSNAEGWAHYCEQMMLDEGYSKDPKMRLGQLQDALLRDARYIVGIEMHTGKRTFDQAIEFFVQEGYQPHEVGVVETKRGTADADLSLLHAGQAANPEAARRLQENARQPILAGGVSQPFSAAGIPAHQDRAQGDAGQRFADALGGPGLRELRRALPGGLRSVLRGLRLLRLNHYLNRHRRQLAAADVQFDVV